jgi:predicted DNA-binding transcriptional regulator AlpA
MMSAHSPVPVVLQPIGLSFEEAARHIGVSETMFKQMVDDGRMPKPVYITPRKPVWNRYRVEAAFTALEMKKAEEVEEWVA